MYRGLAIFTRPLLECFCRANDRLKRILHNHFNFRERDEYEKYTEYGILREAGKDIAFLIERLKETKATRPNSSLSSLIYEAHGLVNLMEAIAPAIRILLSSYLVKLVVGESEDEDYGLGIFDFQVAHSLWSCMKEKEKDVDMGPFVNYDGAYLDLHHILDPTTNNAWIPALADTDGHTLRAKVASWTFIFRYFETKNGNLTLNPIIIEEEESGRNDFSSPPPESQPDDKTNSHEHWKVFSLANPLQASSSASLFDDDLPVPQRRLSEATDLLSDYDSEQAID